MEQSRISITRDMVTLLDESEKDNQFIAVQATTFAQDVWRRFRRNKIAVFGLICVAIITIFAIFGPMFCRFSYDEVDLQAVNQTPTFKHWFGTDTLGRDLFVRVMFGARISLTVGVAATIINLIVGTIYGGIAGYCGGKIDMVMMRIVDIIYSIPTLLYVILVMMFLGSTLKSVIIAIVISSWAGMARTVRAEVLKLRQQEFAVAARVIGAGNRRILVNHLLMNAMGPILVTATLNIPSAIFTEAFLSFVGVGISVPMASWGTLANDALQTMFQYPYQLFFPVAAICITMFSLNFIGDGLSDAFDPKRK